MATIWPIISIGHTQLHNFFSILLIIMQLVYATDQCDVTVAQDGTGNYWSVSDAVMAAPSHSQTKYYLCIKAGTYMENVFVGKDKTNLVFVGDGSSLTKITASRHAPEFSTPFSVTFHVEGDGFIAKYITFENTAGPEKGQAVAVLNMAYHSIFYRCTFLGYTDTLYAKESLQFYRECEIYGTRDFIFGDAAAVFQNCNLYARLPNNIIIFTAQGRKRPRMNTGFTIQNCSITMDPSLSSSYKTSIRGFLGRPWFSFSRVMVMESFLDSIIDPLGWFSWPYDPIDRVTYREFRNWGPGANAQRRVAWHGFEAVMWASKAKPFTASKLIDGDAWIPQTGIPYYGSFASEKW